MSGSVACAAANVPWSAILGTVVGIAGIIGGIVTGHLANRAAAQREISSDQAAERRLQLEQAEADRTRFHDLRVEKYATLLAAAQDGRELAAKLRPLARIRPDQLSAEEQHAVLAPLRDALRKLAEASQVVELLATGPTRQAAKALVENAVIVSAFGFLSEGQFDTWSRQLADAEYAFAQVARAELLPPELAAPTS